MLQHFKQDGYEEPAPNSYPVFLVVCDLYSYPSFKDFAFSIAYFFSLDFIFAFGAVGFLRI